MTPSIQHRGETGRTADSQGLRLCEILAAISLTTEHLVQMCEVSRRRLTYWVQRGIVPDGDAGEAIDRILLIKGQLDTGSNLRQAVRCLERTLKDAASVPEESDPQGAELLVGTLDKIDLLLTRLRDSESSLSDREALALEHELDALDLERTLGTVRDVSGSQFLRQLAKAQYLLNRMVDLKAHC